jgi:hypothetical protein
VEFESAYFGSEVQMMDADVQRQEGHFTQQLRHLQPATICLDALLGGTVGLLDEWMAASWW